MKTDLNEKKFRTDLTSLTSTSRPIELIDNNNHVPTSPRDTYRATTKAHEKESLDTLTTKVDEVLPNLFDPKKGLMEGKINTADITTSSGTHEFDFGIVWVDNKLCLTGTVGDLSITVPLPKTLLKRNKIFNEQADMMRAAYMLLFRCLKLTFKPAQQEERGFKKLIKRLWT